MEYEKLALEYHARVPRGKIFTGLSKPITQQYELSLAYTPGVAGPCREIALREDDSFLYTGRANLVGVITDGTAVLGLGAIGPFAAKPVMEGKAMLFKKFANIDVFDIELRSSSSDAFIEAVAAMEPTFGGINLEDIKAPECFYIEERLRERMSIPIFHDDQHGTAIIAGAAFLNALEVTGRKIEDVRVVFCGSGAAAIGSASLFLSLGVKAENLILTDSKGVLHTRRKDLNAYKLRFARETTLETLGDALRGADVFLGVSAANVLTPDMLLGMAPNPIIFALANPDPEIHPALAREIRPDAIVATGRSDFPNQVNNVLGFPFIFRGALDVRATTINEAMKLAAVKAIAALAKENVTSEVMEAYKGNEVYRFGRDYLIPKPVDSRVLLHVAPAVAKAAMESGVARLPIDLVQYRDHLEDILGAERRIVRKMKQTILKSFASRGQKPQIFVANGCEPRVIRAAKQVVDEGHVRILLAGKRDEILKAAETAGVVGLADHVNFFDVEEEGRVDQFADQLYDLRKRKGMTLEVARQYARLPSYIGALLLANREVDGLVTGIGETYSHALNPLLEVIGTEKGNPLAGLYLVMMESRLLFLADCTVNVEPTAEQLAGIALQVSHYAKSFLKDKTRIALLSYSCFGSKRGSPEVEVLREALQIIKNGAPHGVEVEGEMQADVALDYELMKRDFPFSALTGEANILIFPSLSAGNIGYKMVNKLAKDSIQIGPILLGMRRPANVIQRGGSVAELVNLIYATAQQASLAENLDYKML